MEGQSFDLLYLTIAHQVVADPVTAGDVLKSHLKPSQSCSCWLELDGLKVSVLCLSAARGEGKVVVAVKLELHLQFGLGLVLVFRAEFEGLGLVQR